MTRELQFGNKVRTVCEVAKSSFVIVYVSARQRQQNIMLYADVILTIIAVGRLLDIIV